LRGAVWFLAHHLIHEALEWGDASLAFTSSEDPCPSDVPCREVRPGAHALVLVLNEHWRFGQRADRLVNAPPRLDARLLVGGDHAVSETERLTLPAALVEVQDPASLLLEGGVAREDPAAVGPWADRV